MKNILYTFIALFFSISLNAQFYWTSEHVEINEGMEEEYEKFEAFWGVAKEKAIADGLQAGWSIWKVDPSSNDDNPWADYIIINTYQSKEQMDANVDWMQLIQDAHKGKTKRSVIKKYIKESTDNKYRASSRSYTMQSISNLSEAGRDPSAPINATYIGMEALNDDYVEFEKQYFREQHKGNKYWWDLSEIVDRSDNAYKPITHTIFEVNKENNGSTSEGSEQSFTEKMMSKYGYASREMHGWLQLTRIMKK
jgi:hypothetical protein